MSKINLYAAKLFVAERPAVTTALKGTRMALAVSLLAGAPVFVYLMASSWLPDWSVLAAQVTAGAILCACMCVTALVMVFSRGGVTRMLVAFGSCLLAVMIGLQLSHGAQAPMDFTVPLVAVIGSFVGSIAGALFPYPTHQASSAQAQTFVHAR